MSHNGQHKPYILVLVDRKGNDRLKALSTYSPNMATSTIIAKDKRERKSTRLGLHFGAVLVITITINTLRFLRVCVCA